MIIFRKENFGNFVPENLKKIKLGEIEKIELKRDRNKKYFVSIIGNRKYIFPEFLAYKIPEEYRFLTLGKIKKMVFGKTKTGKRFLIFTFKNKQKPFSVFPD